MLVLTIPALGKGLPRAACEQLMDRLQGEFFPNYGVIASEWEVSVTYLGKFWLTTTPFADH